MLKFDISIRNLSFLGVACLSLYAYPASYVAQLGQKIEEYAISSIEKSYGSMPLKAENEAFIRDMACEMGAPDDIIIRRSSPGLIKAGGDRNAFTVWAVSFCVPLTARPFLYVSEGFFESLSLEEKRFLIAHELTHVKEKHYFYEASCIPPLMLGMHCALYYSLSPTIRGENKLAAASACAAWLITAMAVFLAKQYHMRYNVEKIADLKALEQFHCYDGMIGLMDKIEIKALEEMSWVWWILDHPSCTERKAYCVALQQEYNQKGS